MSLGKKQPIIGLSGTMEFSMKSTDVNLDKIVDAFGLRRLGKNMTGLDEYHYVVHAKTPKQYKPEFGLNPCNEVILGSPYVHFDEDAFGDVKRAVGHLTECVLKGELAIAHSKKLGFLKRLDVHIREVVQRFGRNEQYGSRSKVIYARRNRLWFEKRHGGAVCMAVIAPSGVMIVRDPKVELTGSGSPNWGTISGRMNVTKPNLTQIPQSHFPQYLSRDQVFQAAYGDERSKNDHMSYSECMTKVLAALKDLDIPFVRAAEIPTHDADLEQIVLVNLTKGLS